jgi:hypothetical protein
MRTNIGILTKTENAPVKLLRAQQHEPMLPIPSNIRQSKRVEKWRERIWQARNKWFVLLGPQYRELVRKITFSCEQAGLPGLVPHLRMGLFFAWFVTGNLRKLEDFIVAVFDGQVFLMNHKAFLPDNIRSDLPQFELRKSMLLYDPSQHKGGINMDQALRATHFLAFLDPITGPTPWIEDLVSEVAEVRRQAAAELGENVVQEFLSGPETTRESEDEGHKPGKLKQKLVQRISYW